MRFHSAWLLVALAVLACAAVARPALAQVAPAPSPSASPSPAPARAPQRFHLGFDSYTSGTNQQFVGDGAFKAYEIPNFLHGGALAPGTPYDFFSGGPQTTGEGLSVALILDPVYALTKSLDLSFDLGYGTINGSGNVAAYWGDALLPTLNPHLGARAFSVPPAFTTHNGQDSVSATRFSVLSGSLALHDGDGALTAGWFNLHQSVPFVFAQAPWTNTPQQLVPQIPQSLGNGSPSNDVLKPVAPILPLQGVDLWVKSNLATIEVADANLPAPAFSPARAQSLSVVIDHGDGLTYSFELAHLAEWGPDTARVLFGNSPTLTPSGSGLIPQSTVYGQQMAVAGAAATFPIGRSSSAGVRLGYSCYSASGSFRPSSTCTSGNYYELTAHHGFANFDLGLELVRFDPEYAPALLNYGTLENVWSAPDAWPGTWLHGSYQFVDNSEVGANRQGFRLSSTFLLGGVETRLAFARYAQISPLDNTTAYTPGFVDPYFLPQVSTAHGTLGVEQHASAWFGWHPKPFDVTLDLSDVTVSRPAPLGASQDAVSMNYPAAVLAFSRNFGPKVFGAWGVGEIGLSGAYDDSGAENAALTQDVIFAGAELRQNANSSYALQWQLFSVRGSPAIPGGFSPAYHGPQVIFYQRFKT